jgi:hypothetical protein
MLLQEHMSDIHSFPSDPSEITATTLLKFQDIPNKFSMLKSILSYGNLKWGFHCIFKRDCTNRLHKLQ